MRSNKKCLISILVGIAMLLPYCAVMPVTASADPVPYLALGTVSFYGQPTTSSAKLGELHRGDVFSVTGTASSGGITWHLTYASVKNEDGTTAYTQGYVPNQNVRVFTQAELEAYLSTGKKPDPGANVSNAPPAGTTAAPSAGSGGSSSTGVSGTVVVNISSGRANIRASANPTATIIEKVANGTRLTALSSSTGTDGALWYRVSISSRTGYIRSDLVRAGVSDPTGGASNTAESNADKISNYSSDVLELKVDAASIYLAADTTSTRVYTLYKGAYVANLKSPVQGSDGYTWYRISYSTSESTQEGVGSTYTGYMRGDGLKPYGSTTATNPPSSSSTGSDSMPSGQRYIVSTVGSANMRDGAGTNYKAIAKIPSGTTVAETKNQKGTDGAIWRYVSTGKQAGWIRSDLLTSIYTPATEPPISVTSSPSPAPAYPASGYIIATRDTRGYGNIAYSATDGLTYDRVVFSMLTSQVATVLNVREITMDTGAKVTFYQANFAGTTGWVNGGDVRIPMSNEIPAPAPTPAATLSPQYAGSYVVSLTNQSGYESFYGTRPVFSMVAGQLAKIYAVVPKGTSYRPSGSSTSTEKTTEIWYWVRFAEQYGYVPESRVRVLSAEEAANLGLSEGTVVTPIATPTPPPSSVARPYQVKIGISNVALRSGPAMTATSLKTLTPSTVCTYLDQVIGSDGYIWYHVTHYSSTGYVRSDLASIVYSDGTTSGGTATAPPSGGSAAGSLMAVAAGDTNLRSGMGTNFGVVAKMQRGEIMQIKGNGTGTDYNVWYSVTSLLTGKSGYVRGDLLRQLTAQEQAANSGGSSGTPGGDTNITLKYGSTGTEVTRMQNALISLGYLTGSVTLGVFDANTQTAVRKFQQAVSLTVDGIAGPTTLQKLYESSGGSSGGSTPPSSGSVGYSLGNVELVNWFTGDVKASLERSSAKITVVSVETKKAFNAKYRWGTQHADCEPLTASDTAIGWSIRNSSGYKDRIPVWVIAGGRTFASSMYYWEHDSSSDTIKDNNYSGIFCLHFQGSTTHTNQNPSATVNQDHQKSVMIAYNAAH